MTLEDVGRGLSSGGEGPTIGVIKSGYMGMFQARLVKEMVGERQWTIRPCDAIARPRRNLEQSPCRDGRMVVRARLTAHRGLAPRCSGTAPN